MSAVVDGPDNPMQPVDPTAPSGPRYDAQNRLLCHARTRSGALCNSPSMVGQKVCRMHGGASPQARNKAQLRLARLVDPAIAILAQEMVRAEKSADRQRAANSVLDRAGVARVIKSPDSDVARALLLERLREMRGGDATTDEGDE